MPPEVLTPAPEAVQFEMERVKSENAWAVQGPETAAGPPSRLFPYDSKL
jgi:hypothetical protein